MADGKGYTFTGKTGPEEAKPTDTDLDHASPHHTIGKGPLQASAGNHTHSASEVGLAAHTHPAGEINADVLNAARLGTGTANVDKYLRGDSSWQTLHPPLWDDLRVSLRSSSVGAASPAMTVFRDDVRTYAFSKTLDQSLYFDAQLPHSWIAGTGIRPHIHWSPGASTNLGVVRWALEYTWANAVNAPGNTFPASTILTVDQAAAGAYSHQIAAFPEIAGTGMRLSSVLICRIARIGTATQDTFDDVAFGLSLDFHIQNSGDGSTDEYTGA